jgi:hypothetical protein
MVITTGIKRMTTGVLLIKADATATTDKMEMVVKPGFPLDIRMIRLATYSTEPVLTKPLLIKNMAPIVTTAGCASPATDSCGSRTRQTTNVTMIPMAVKATGIFSVMKRTRLPTSMVETIQISKRYVLNNPVFPQ